MNGFKNQYQLLFLLIFLIGCAMGNKLKAQLESFNCGLEPNLDSFDQRYADSDMFQIYSDGLVGY